MAGGYEMAQIFSARTDRILRRLLVAFPLFLAFALLLGFWHVRSGSYWGVGRSEAQPIGFRHDLHVGRLGLGCLDCHAGAGREEAAAMPPASKCLECHAETWRGVDALRPLFTSVELGQPIVWRPLYRLPDHSHFHHGAHAAAGIDCAACHGDVARMVTTVKAEPMSMAWCLDCHRKAGDPVLTDCSTCHY